MSGCTPEAAENPYADPGTYLRTTLHHEEGAAADIEWAPVEMFHDGALANQGIRVFEFDTPDNPPCYLTKDKWGDLRIANAETRRTATWEDFAYGHRAEDPTPGALLYPGGWRVLRTRGSETLAELYMGADTARQETAAPAAVPWHAPAPGQLRAAAEVVPDEALAAVASAGGHHLKAWVSKDAGIDVEILVSHPDGSISTTRDPQDWDQVAAVLPRHLWPEETRAGRHGHHAAAPDLRALLDAAITRRWP